MASLEDIRQILAQIELRLARLEAYWLREAVDDPGHMTGHPEVYLPDFTDEQRASFLGDLTEREREAARWVCECLSNDRIGAQMGLSQGTVANLLTSVYDKLRATGVFGEREVARAELVRFMGAYWRE